MGYGLECFIKNADMPVQGLLAIDVYGSSNFSGDYFEGNFFAVKHAAAVFKVVHAASIEEARSQKPEASSPLFWLLASSNSSYCFARESSKALRCAAVRTLATLAIVAF